MQRKTNRYRLPVAGIIILSSIIGIPKIEASGVTPVVATTTSTTVLTPTTTTPPLVPSPIMSKWQKVAWCETHARWWSPGLHYDGGLGIAPYNWDKYAPKNFPRRAHLATPEQQVYVAIRIQIEGGVGNYVPDQDGACTAW